MDTWTFPGPSAQGKGNTSFISTSTFIGDDFDDDLLDFESFTDFQQSLLRNGCDPVDARDHPTAIFWRIVSQAAHDLPLTHPDRDFLINASQGDIQLAGRQYNLGRMSAHRRWKRFLGSLGLSVTSYARK